MSVLVGVIVVVADTGYDTKNKLEVKKLTVSRSELPVFQSIELCLSSGESVQISGANGSGKTTLLRAICGLCNSHEGEVIWNTLSIYHQPSAFYQKMLYLGHALGLKPKLTAEQNLNFYRNLRFEPEPDLIINALRQLGIGAYHDEYVARMSAGQKRRVALARIITEPVPLWILDEPMAALDVKAQRWMEYACNAHLEKGGLLIITSHQPISGIHGLRELRLS